MALDALEDLILIALGSVGYKAYAHRTDISIICLKDIHCGKTEGGLNDSDNIFYIFQNTYLYSK
jgi:hypothetical protein